MATIGVISLGRPASTGVKPLPPREARHLARRSRTTNMIPLKLVPQLTSVHANAFDVVSHRAPRKHERCSDELLFVAEEDADEIEESSDDWFAELELELDDSPRTKKTKKDEDASQHSGHSKSVWYLHMLPRDIILSALEYLNVTDLCSFSKVSRECVPLGGDWYLWSALYVKRWPVFRLQESMNWKSFYKCKDESEVKSLTGLDSTNEVYFKQMLRSRRPRKRNEFDIIRKWKKDNICVKSKDAHDCSSDTCTYYRNDTIFICEQTGLVHFCSPNSCLIQVMTPEGTVCPISGASYGSHFTYERENNDEDCNGGDETAPFLGQCYEHGYNSASFGDVMKKCF